MTSWLGRVLEVEVGPVAHGGHCVARAEGRVVFVRHALPGEQVRVEVTEDNGGSFFRGGPRRVVLSRRRRRGADAVFAPGPAALPARRARWLRRLRLAARFAGLPARA